MSNSQRSLMSFIIANGLFGQVENIKFNYWTIDNSHFSCFIALSYIILECKRFILIRIIQFSSK